MGTHQDVTGQGDAHSDWQGRQAALLHLATLQLFFVGGAPRSGTTWLQLLLGSHPEVSCHGEGLFQQHLADPLDALMAARAQAIAAKNERLFRPTGGFAPPTQDDADMLLATGILLGLERQRAGKPCRAIGEKTPENVFLFPCLKRLFPAARFIGIVRDPRDILASAWHIFHKAEPGEDADAAKAKLAREACPQLDAGMRAMLALRRRYRDDCMIVSYERLHAEPQEVAAGLFRFLDVSDAAETVAACVARTSFEALSGGRRPGQAQTDAFFRQGLVGGWRATLNAETNALILRALGWSFPEFGWTP